MAQMLSFTDLQDLYIQKNNLINKFVALQNEYFDLPHEHGGNMSLTVVELHTLKTIENNPGITVTEMAQQGMRTKGAISQIVKKLEKRGYLFRKRCPVDGKRVLLHVNEEGERISMIYKKSSTDDIRIVIDKLLKKCEPKEIDAFFSVMTAYIEVLEKELKK